MLKKKVLLFEPYKPTNDLYAIILKHYSVVLHAVPDELSLLKRVKDAGADRYDLILAACDPELKVVDAIRKIRTLDEKVPICVTSLYKDAKRDVLNAGADSFVFNPSYPVIQVIFDGHLQ